VIKDALQPIVLSVFNVFLGVIYGLLSIVLIPLDALVDTFAPALTDYISAITDFLDLITTYIGWAIDASGIPVPILGLIVAYLVFKLTAPVQVWLIKFGVMWYSRLKT